MRRLARRLFTLCSAMSLLLCVAVCAMWVRGLSVHDAWRWHQGRAGSIGFTIFAVHSGSGQLHLRYIRDHTNMLVWDGFRYQTSEVAPIQWRGSWRVTRSADGREVDRWIDVPYWVLVVATGALPVGRVLSWHYLRRVGRRRLRAGLCPACGYDLRASPGRCPECGAVV